MDDNKGVSEEELAAAAKAPRITAHDIDSKLAMLTYETHRFPGTNTTVAAAMLGKFTLAIGMSACVNDENFDAEFGVRLAKENARKKAKDALWELEGYCLYKRTKLGE